MNAYNAQSTYSYFVVNMKLEYEKYDIYLNLVFGTTWLTLKLNLIYSGHIRVKINKTDT